MKNILVVQLARFGDILQSKRLVLSAAAEPETTVHLCLDVNLVSLARLVYPQAVLHPVQAHVPPDAAGEAALAAVFEHSRATFEELSRLDFTAVYTLNATPMTLAIATMFPPEIVTGYAMSKGQPLRSRWAAMFSRLTEDRLSSPLNLVDYWGHFHPSPIAPAKVNPVARRAGSGRYGLVMAGQQARRSLPPKVLAGVVTALFKAYQGPSFVCLGTKRERPLVRQLLRELPSRIVERVEDQTGNTALVDLPDILAGLDGVLTPDTGIMHLACHVGVPVQAVFLSSAWCFETGPYGLGHKVWQAVEPCLPCLETVPCPHEVRCLHHFAAEPFLRHISGEFGEAWPTGMGGFVTNFDSLGLVYRQVDGEDPACRARLEKRLAVQAVVNSRNGLDTCVPAGAAERVFADRDCMLP